MLELVTTKLEQWIQASKAAYNVDPIVFFIISTAAAPVFYYSIYQLVRSVAKREKGKITFWSTLFLCSVAAPYLYVLFFGRNFPWWVYIVIGLLAAQGVYSLVKKLWKKPETPEEN